MSDIEMGRAVDEILDPPAVALALKVPERTLGQWRYQGKGPRWFKVGRHARYLRSDLDAFVQAQRQAAVR